MVPVIAGLTRNLFYQGLVRVFCWNGKALIAGASVPLVPAEGHTVLRASAAVGVVTNSGATSYKLPAKRRGSSSLMERTGKAKSSRSGMTKVTEA
jgi:hypothetical protein